MNTTTPKVSVIMPTFNRLELLKESLASILDQTYRNYELIIIDDASTDGTQEYMKEISEKDKRIVYVRNRKRRRLIYGLRLGCRLAKGEYIARMDDDDISLPERFDKQVKFLDANPDIAVVGTFIELLGNDPAVKVWVDNFKPEYCAIDTFYRCPLCHPTVMMRKSFLLAHHIEYDVRAFHAEDTMLWVDVILAGGKIANIPEVLLKYRVGHTRVSSDMGLRRIRDEVVRRARQKMWRLYYSRRKSKELSFLHAYPKLNPVNERLCNALLETAEKDRAPFPRDVFYDYLVHTGVRAETMNICFAGNNKVTPQMCTAMTSIVRHKRSCDNINFFILENNISDKNKARIKRLEGNDVSVEFVRVDIKMFEKRCPTGRSCRHVPVQTYFRYLIPQLKPQYEKVIYLDCDVIVRKSLVSLWNKELGDNYAAAVQEFYRGAANAMKLKVPRIFNAGVLLLNNKKLVEDGITDKFFINTQKFWDKIVYVDQDILNYTFNGKVLWLSPPYNAQIDLWRPGTCAKSIYDTKFLTWGRKDPIVVHYNSPNKPWKRTGLRILRKFHPFIHEYFENLKHTPYKWKYAAYLWYRFEDFFHEKIKAPTCDIARMLCRKFKRTKR